MAGTQPAASFPINLDGNAAEKSREFAGELEKLRQRIEGGTSSLKGLEGQMKRLQAASVVDVAAARDLKTKIQEQKDAIAAASTQVSKLGTTYEQLADKAKRAGRDSEDLKKKTKSLDDAVRSASPKAAELGDKFSGLFDLLSGSSVLEIASVGVLAIAAALVAATVAAVAFGAAMAVQLAKFIVESQNAARAANLLRLAFAGTDQNAANLGTQVDALARKVATSKGEINKLAVELTEAGFQGQTLVDTLNAMGQASAAGADKASAKIREVLERGKLTGRVGLNPLELMGSGLKFDEIASSLADQMGIGVAAARQRLLAGAVPLGDAAAAMRKAIEAKFGDLNAAKLLDFDTQVAKFKENLAALAKDVSLGPLLTDVKSLFALFSESTVTGQGIKQLITAFGSGFVDSVHSSTPVAKAFIEGLVLGALKIYGHWLSLRIAVRDAFANSETLKKMKDFADKVDLVSLAGKVGVFALGALAGAIFVVGTSLAFVLAPFVAFGLALVMAADGAAKIAQKYLDVGRAIVDGILNPLKTQQGIEEAVNGFVDKLKAKLQAKLQIHSPSALMRDEVGHDTGAGVIQGTVEGIEQGVPDISRALDHMIPPASSSTGKRGVSGAANDNAGGAARELHLHFHVPNKETAEAIKEPSTYGLYLRMVEEALKSMGLPVPQ